MAKKAEMIIARHRAVFSKPGELGKLVGLEVKRSRKPAESSPYIL